MQALIELIAGFIALLAAAALSHFGVDLHRPAAPDREVRRVTTECREVPVPEVVVAAKSPRC